MRTSWRDGAESLDMKLFRNMVEPEYWKCVNFNSGTISLRVGCWEYRKYSGVARLRLRRHRMPCKRSRRNVPCDGSRFVALEVKSKVRSVRAVAVDKSPDTDAREVP